MKIVQKTIHITTTKQFQVFPVTKQVEQILADSGVQNGICLVYAPHSTGGVVLNDNEPLLHQDVMKMFYRVAPIDIVYGHDSFEQRSNVKPGERSNGHAHVKAFLINSSEIIPVNKGRVELGEHQQVFFIEFDGARPRTLNVTVMGE